MIVFDATTDTLVVTCGSATTSTAPDFYTSYVDVTTTTFSPKMAKGTLNGTSEVTLITGPAASTVRQLKFLSVFNRDSVAVSPTISYDDNSTLRTVWRGVLGVNECLQYVDGAGWRVYNAAGVPIDSARRGLQGIAVPGTTITGQTMSLGTGGMNPALTGQSMIVQAPKMAEFTPFGPYGSCTYTYANAGESAWSLRQYLSIRPVILPAPIDAQQLRLYISGSQSTSSNSSWRYELTYSGGIYTDNAGTLSLLTSGSTSFRLSNTSNSWDQNNSGLKCLQVPLSANLTAGQYWLAVYSDYASTNAAWFTGRQMMENAYSSRSSIGYLDATTYASYQRLPGFGAYSAQFTTAMPVSVNYSDIYGVSLGQTDFPFYNIVNSAHYARVSFYT
jgi:hypothetical protein